MELLKCPECGNEFQGEACPVCGCPANDCSIVEHIEKSYENNKNFGIRTACKFVKSNLLPGETIKVSAEWETGPIILALILSVIIIFGLIVVGIVLVIVLLLIRAAIKSQEFVITNKRVIAYYGFIRRIAFELKIEQVESITIYQSYFQRLFDCGTVKVCGVGASKATVNFVKKPFEFRQHFYDMQYKENNNTQD